jgi:long-chain acyl-CoA synthetase
LAKGPSITTGYLNNEQMNALNFTADGFYRTGDIFELFDETEGSASLNFICRSDELLVYPNGEKFNPIPIEQEILQRSAYVQRICLILNEEKITVAVIEPKQHVISEENLQEKIFEEINQRLSRLPYFARVSSKFIMYNAT